jgi:tetratricopeptide (TPR) repeat protein
MIRSVLRQAWPSLALAAVLLLTAAFVVRACYFRNDICFLVERAPAHWIIYPSPPSAATRPGLPLDAIFRRSFSLASVPVAARLGVRVFRACTIQLNGGVVPIEFDSDHWKVEAHFDVARFLRPGRNDLEVTVTNASGPPALWLTVSCSETVLVSDKSWEVSLAGATWLPAALAADPAPFANADRDRYGEQVIPSVEKVWPMWLLFGGMSAATVWFGRRWLAGGKPWTSNRQDPAPGQRTSEADHEFSKRRLKRVRRRSTPSPGDGGDIGRGAGWLKTLLQPPGPHSRWIGLTRLLFGLIAIFWVALFLHNSPYLASDLGFDAKAHLAYINHFRTSWSIPLPGQAWGLQHPPLYYILVGALLRVVGTAPDAPGGILTIRLFNLVLALLNVYTILACLRLVFPEHPRRWVLGLIVAGFLPMFLYLYHYPLNHCLAGTLASVTLYFVFRILCAPNASTWDYALAGLALGSAILSIISASVLVVPVGVILLAKSFADRAKIPWRRAALRILVLAASVFAVCGWYYLYVWANLGTPIVGNMGFGVGSPWAWWQDPGFNTGGNYLRFGESLRSPWFGAWYSVWDGFYCTLWGDGYCGGTVALEYRPPWSYDYMVAGMWLALAPTAAIVLGGGAVLLGFLRKPTMPGAFLLGTAFAIVSFVTYYPLLLPYSSAVKASYGIAAMLPLCVLAALGFDLLAASSCWLRGVVFIVLGTWAMNSAASYVISPGAAQTQRCVARQLAVQQHLNQAIAKLEPVLAAHPDDDFTRILLANLYIYGKLDGPARQVLELPAGQCERSSRHYLLGILLARTKRTADARREFQMAQRLAPDDLAAASAYAQAVSRGPSVPAAIEAWRNVLRTNPEITDAHAALVRLYLDAGDPSSAHRHEKYLQALREWIRQSKARHLY